MANVGAPQERLVVLDFYRFVAAYGVALYHISEFASNNGAFDSVTRDFYLLVDFFFILSGFVIGKNYFKVVRTPFEIFRFLQKRIARIYPLYFATTLIFLANFELGGSSTRTELYKTGSILAQLFMVQQWQLNPPLPLNFPAWSISAEWAMYLLFPLFAIVGIRMGNISVLALAGLSAVCFWLLILSGAVIYPGFNALRALPTFIIGVSLSQLSLKIKNGATIGLIVFGSSLVLILLHAPSIVIVAAFGVTIWVTAADPASTKFLNSHVLGVLGDLSYSVYMIHAVSYTISYKFLAPKLAPDHLVFFGFLVSIFVVLASFPVYYLFEKPARKFLSAPWIGP